MPTYLTPNVYMEELSSGAKPIVGVSTSTACFIGVAEKGPIGKATFVSNFAEFVKWFGGPIRIDPTATGQYDNHYLYYAVRHFFQEGGTMAYIVRVAHYTDVDNPASLTAVAASQHDFDGTEVDGTTLVNDALTVSAINEGKWGEGLQVQLENSSKFAVLLKETIPANPVPMTITLAANSDVEIGSLLWIIEEVTGAISSADETAKTVTFKSNLTRNGADFTGTLPVGAIVFSSDFKLVTGVINAAVSVTPGTDTTVELQSVTNVDNEVLRNGAVVGFALNRALVVVTKIGEKMLGTERVMTVDVDFTGQTFTLFDPATAHVYARDFTLRVKSAGVVVETHEHLSNVPTNAVDYVGNRLGPTSGNSLYIAAAENAADEVLLDNKPYMSLLLGDDGLAGLSDADVIGSSVAMTGLSALDLVTDGSILVIPNASEAVSVAAIAYVKKRKDMFYITECPLPKLKDTDPIGPVQAHRDVFGNENYAAIYHPWIKIADPFTGRQVRIPPSGAVAGVYADTDGRRGVHKAPAGVEDGYLNVATGIDAIITPGQNDLLYPKQINVIRKFPEGIVVWGGRTMSQDTEWIYLNVRRLFIFLEQSIENGTQWTVFEPNDRTLWKSIERNVAAFLRVQWRKGALVGEKEEHAFYVKCDEETNPQEVIDAGQVITEIGVAPSKPAEFVVFRIKQFAGVAA